MRLNCVSIVASALCFALSGMSVFAAEDPDSGEPAAEEAEDDESGKKVAAAAASVDSYPSDADRFDGDRLKLRVNVPIFEPIGGAGQGCAPKGSKLAVLREDGEFLYVRFYEVPGKEKKKLAFIKFKEDPDDESLVACGISSEDTNPGSAHDGKAKANAEANADNNGNGNGNGKAKARATPVNTFTQYQVKRAELLQYDFRRTGVTFGGMVVPFKYYLGGDGGKLSSSSTIAPYVGFRGPGPFGLTFTPVVSAGLGLVPVTDSATNETSTKTAFSTAIGARITTTKNDKFNAGMLFGRDFLNKSDRGTDQYVDNVWFSLYVGYKL